MLDDRTAEQAICNYIDRPRRHSLGIVANDFGS